MATIKENYGVGLRIIPGHSGDDPDLATALRDVADDIGDLAGALVDWTDELTVTTNEVTLARAGAPIAVEATTATSGGAKQIQYSGSPAAGFVTVAFTAGVATLTFNGTDAVTGARVLLSPAPASVRTLKG